MKPLRTLHVYGSVAIQSIKCPLCKDHAFVRSGVMSCCGTRIGSGDPDRIKYEVDKTGARRKPPPKWMQRQILEDQGYKCYYCLAQFDSWRKWDGRPRRVLIAWDHVEPYCYDHNNNEFVAACRECNAIKSDKTFSSSYEAKTYLRLKIHERTTQAP